MRDRSTAPDAASGPATAPEHVSDRATPPAAEQTPRISTEGGTDTAEAAHRRSRTDQVAGILGEILLTAAIVVLLYAAYILWGTGLATMHAQDQLVEQTIATWGPSEGNGPSAQPVAPQPPAEAVPDPGEGFAVLRIPRLGTDWRWVVVEGVTTQDLARGPGHYPRSALPGQVGNFAVAGHRSGHGEPFARFDQLRRGDEVIVETEVGIYTYTVDRSEIVDPTATWVIDPVPGRPDAQPTQALVTLTTCHPRWGSTQRLIVFGHLVDAEARQGDS